MSPPILYSFRRCPYAIRARLAVAKSGQTVELREILLKEKPQEMLRVSSKGTVPVAVLDGGMVLDESLEIMLWVLARNDPDNWLRDIEESLALVYRNDEDFKYWLDRYKYQVGYPEHSQQYYRDRATDFLEYLESKISAHQFLLGDEPRLADLAIFPFVRQFAFVDKPWFDSSGYTSLQSWLEHWLRADLFQYCMQKYMRWNAGNTPIQFPSE